MSNMILLSSQRTEDNLIGLYVYSDSPEGAADHARMQAFDRRKDQAEGKEPYKGKPLLQPVVLVASDCDIGHLLEIKPNGEYNERYIPVERFGEVPPGAFRPSGYDPGPID